MHTTPAPIFLLSGPPGSGKSTLADLLVKQYPRGMHIPVDDLREWVVAGRADPVPTWTDETTRQFRLARQSAALLARKYAKAGFAVAVDDVIFPEEAARLYEKPFKNCPCYKILLLPSLETCLKRNLERTNKNFDTTILDQTIRGVHQAMQGQPFIEYGWQVIKPDGQSPFETAQVILEMLGLRIDF